MPYLPVRPDLDQLRHQAKDLLHAARCGDPDALARIRAVSGRIILSSAQLALAHEYGFPSWARLKLELERRDILNSRDLSRLARLLAEHPVGRLLGHGADPNLRDLVHHRTPLEDCQFGNSHHHSPGHAEVEAILRPLTRQQDASVRAPRS